MKTLLITLLATVQVCVCTAAWTDYFDRDVTHDNKLETEYYIGAMWKPLSEPEALITLELEPQVRQTIHILFYSGDGPDDYLSGLILDASGVWAIADDGTAEGTRERQGDYALNEPYRAVLRAPRRAQTVLLMISTDQTDSEPAGSLTVKTWEEEPSSPTSPSGLLIATAF